MQKLDSKINWLIFTTRTIFSIFVYALFGFTIYITNQEVPLFFLQVLIYTISGIILLLTLVSNFVLPFLTYKYYSYQVNEENIHIIKGIIYKTEIIIPIKRIQHVEKFEGPLQMLFKQASVLIFTAGSAQSIIGLSKDVAVKVSKEIEDKLITYLNLNEDLKDE